ncbi:D-3-phosphoglycerate dehydrogenase-like [Saccoglossus kowalevskii]|uniref:D-3-phosphoglycerate dehydrogenase n=1 Tax=Saccoglossus kowalevskii TaxID=10224 RepID=A0ABM0GUN6_SACKO|nr:PREDICTED: d-3-phosphoglycerate dehydrogenase-like [Saccoglossus kowalevskii]
MPCLLERVLITDVIDPCCAKILQNNGIEVDTKVGLSPDQLKEEVVYYDGIILRSATYISAEIIQKAAEVKLIAFAGTGTDSVDNDAASDHGIIVMNAPGANTISTAEHTCAMILTVVRNLPQAYVSMKEGKWETEKLTGISLDGRTLAVIGLGAIGREVVKRMKSFRVKLIGYDPMVTAKQAKEIGVEWLPLHEIWPRADIVTLHLPAIPQTFGMINDAMFAKCRRGMYLINAARGAIVKEDSLLKALNNGTCAAAALDVFQEEPTRNEELICHPRVVVTPHLGANTIEAQIRVAANVAQQFVDASSCIKLAGTINARSMQGNIHAWYELGRRLGYVVAMFIGHLSCDTKVQVITCGSGTKGGARYMKYATEIGLLEAYRKLKSKDSEIDIHTGGVEVTIGHEDMCSSLPLGFNHGCKVAIHYSNTTMTFCGSVRGNDIMLCSIDSCLFECGALLAGNMVFYRSSEANAFLPVTELSSESSCQIEAFASTTPVYNQKWTILYLNQPQKHLEPIRKHVAFLMQISM